MLNFDLNNFPFLYGKQVSEICHFDERWNKRNNESTKILNAQNEQKVQRAPKEDGEVKVEAFEWFFEPT